MDGFTHPIYVDIWSNLIRAAMDWGGERGASSFHATLSVEDFEKKEMFEELGFRESGAAADFFLDGEYLKEFPDGRSVSALRMSTE